MPINNLPGVGPTNADIATAVAAPSAATIAAAVAAPSAATIAAAVAAPSAATIASTVAGSVPTLAQITSAITTNAAPAATTVAAITAAGNSAGWGATGGPFSGTYAVAGFYFVNVSGPASTFTFSNLSSYKYLRIITALNNGNSAGITALRFNGDTGSNYSLGQYGGILVNAATPPVGDPSWGNNHMRLSHANIEVGNYCLTDSEVFATNTTMRKLVYTKADYKYTASNSATVRGVSGWDGAGITSLTIYNTAGTNWSAGYVYVLGAY